MELADSQVYFSFAYKKLSGNETTGLQWCIDTMNSGSSSPLEYSLHSLTNFQTLFTNWYISTLFFGSPIAQFLNTTSSSHLRGERINRNDRVCCAQKLRVPPDLLLTLKLLSSRWLRRGCLWAFFLYRSSPLPPCALSPWHQVKSKWLPKWDTNISD